jgi:hypothetical protein
LCGLLSAFLSVFYISPASSAALLPMAGSHQIDVHFQLDHRS